MRNLMLGAGLLAAALVAGQSAIADDRDRDNDDKLTVAVVGDWPYSQNLLDKSKLLTESVNADRDVSLAIHVGDIHSGSMPCRSAGILPPLQKSNPGWNQAVYYVFQQFKAPVVYTPGDNEWSDCHKSKQLSAGDPLKELASVRQLFFAKPGKTLGMTEKTVYSQTQYFDPGYPDDAQFVENVMWSDKKVVFATFNMPGGSNNDLAPWTGQFSNPTAQAQEVATRSAANIRWLQAAFQYANQINAKAIVIALQADMWDPAALPAAGGSGLDQYTPFVQQLATLSNLFFRPVLLLNGDTHLYFTDRPLANPNSATGLIHNTPPMRNLQRIVVQGSTNPPAEWLRLTINPQNFNTFDWTNVTYCDHPDIACNWKSAQIRMNFSQRPILAAGIKVQRIDFIF